MTQVLNKMKTALISVSMLVLATTVATSVINQEANAWETTTISPSFGGGYTMNSFGSNGSSFGSINPSFGGGYTYNFTDSSGGFTSGTISPSFGGGVTINEYKW